MIRMDIARNNTETQVQEKYNFKAIDLTKICDEIAINLEKVENGTDVREHAGILQKTFEEVIEGIVP